MIKSMAKIKLFLNEKKLFEINLGQFLHTVSKKKFLRTCDNCFQFLSNFIANFIILVPFKNRIKTKDRCLTHIYLRKEKLYCV